MDQADGSRSNGMPSWVPDWRFPTVRRSIPLFPPCQSLDIIHQNEGTIKICNNDCFGVVGHIFGSFPRNADSSRTQSWIEELLEWIKDRAIDRNCGVPLSELALSYLYAEALHILTAKTRMSEGFLRPFNIADYVDDVSKYVEGRLLFILSADPPFMAEGLNWPRLGIGPSHTQVGDIICGGHTTVFTLHGTLYNCLCRSLLLRETQQSIKKRVKPLWQYVIQEPWPEPFYAWYFIYGPGLDWRDVEFEIIGQSMAYILRKSEFWGDSGLSSLPPQISARNVEDIFGGQIVRIKSMTIR
ncbi:hypothetical protein F5Y13DRAFT_165967 [Hypoxylon sp. FL1857]|nr:hypothetical protein F5Y13DRAFT_165967 [Hypoxylon sp. FL1857]